MGKRKKVESAFVAKSKTTRIRAGPAAVSRTARPAALGTAASRAAAADSDGHWEAGLELARDMPT